MQGTDTPSTVGHPTQIVPRSDLVLVLIIASLYRFHGSKRLFHAMTRHYL
jgi:hypothetical protein